MSSAARWRIGAFILFGVLAACRQRHDASTLREDSPSTDSATNLVDQFKQRMGHPVYVFDNRAKNAVIFQNALAAVSPKVTTAMTDIESLEKMQSDCNDLITNKGRSWTGVAKAEAVLIVGGTLYIGVSAVAFMPVVTAAYIASAGPTLAALAGFGSAVSAAMGVIPAIIIKAPQNNAQDIASNLAQQKVLIERVNGELDQFTPDEINLLAEAFTQINIIFGLPLNGNQGTINAMFVHDIKARQAKINNGSDSGVTNGASSSDASGGVTPSDNTNAQASPNSTDNN